MGALEMLLRSLFERKRKIDAGPRLRRLMDMTVPNRPVCNETRGENRYNRSLPALVLPWVKDAPVLAEPSVGILQDISDSGLSLIFTEKPKHENYLLGFCLIQDDAPEFFFFIANVRTIRRFAPGLTSVGCAVTSCADISELKVETRVTVESLVHEYLLPVE